MSEHWHTDRYFGEFAVLPNGTLVRVVMLRGERVRIEYIDPARKPDTVQKLRARIARQARSKRYYPAGEGGAT